MNIKKIMGAIFFFLLLSWGYYTMTILKLFSEVTELITPGTSYMIQLLEFTNYRGEELFKSLILFFILISLNFIFSFYVINKVKEKRIRRLTVGINIMIIAVIVLVSNIFWTVYLLLAIISGLVISASYYVYKLLFSKTIEFDSGDILYKSDLFESEWEAKQDFEKKTKSMGSLSKELISGKIFEIDNSYIYEIYANNKLILSSEGEILDYEKK